MRRRLFVHLEYPTPDGVKVRGHTYTVDAGITQEGLDSVVKDFTTEQAEADGFPPASAVVYTRLSARF